MKFQTVPSKFQNTHRYQAQFQDVKAAKRAKEWLASRSSEDHVLQKNCIYTSDLQVIFELRVYFDHTIKLIQAAPAA